MTRGRPRDVDARDRILDAAFRLLSAPDRGEVRIDDIAAEAKVGKQTIYRWWPSRDAVAIDALLRGTLHATPFPDTGSTRDDLRAHLRMVAAMFSSSTGALIKTTVGEAQRDDAATAEFQQRFWAPRRELSAACLRRGIERGEVREGIDVELALDALYGPLWIRLLFGHLPITAATADGCLEVVWPHLVNGRGSSSAGHPRARRR